MRIRLELISDLCPASGENLAGVVDSEIYLDEYGIPYIPARRLKGCLREAALEIKDLLKDSFDQEVFESLFGRFGSAKGGSLRLKDGYIDSYEAIKKQIFELKKEANWNTVLENQFIMSYFTSLRSQTCIDSKFGTAKENSLRTMRVINRGFVFFFEAEVRGEQEIKLLEHCCKAVRHMGLNRTRGLGEIKCQLVRNEELSMTSIKVPEKEIFDTIEYVLELESPVVITSVDSGGKSENYIPGSSLLGFFAGEYLKMKKATFSGNAHECLEFRRMFLDGSVTFTNAYPTYLAKKEYLDFFPCPVSVVKIKDKEEYLDTAWEETSQPVEKLSGKYIHFHRSRSFYLIEPEKEVHYHHKRHPDRSIGHAVGNRIAGANTGEFFQYQVLKKGQFFKGRIIGAKQDLEKIVQLISSNIRLSIGKSRTAQYGAVKIVDYRLIDRRQELDCKNVKKDQKFLVQLLSPLILVNEQGHIAPDVGIFKGLLAKELGDIDSVKNEDTKEIFLKYKSISGYNAKWTLPRQKVLAFDSGSVFKFVYLGEKSQDLKNVELRPYGLRTSEGYGQISISLDERTKLQKRDFESKHISNLGLFSNELFPLMQHCFSCKIKQEIRLKAFERFNDWEERNEKNITNTFASKLYFFLKQSDTVEGFFDTIYRLCQKKNQKTKVKESVEILLFGTSAGKTLKAILEECKEHDNYKAVPLSKEDWHSVEDEMKGEIIFQCKTAKLNYGVAILDKMLADHLENNRDIYLQEYFLCFLRQLQLKGRNERGSGNA